MVRRVRHKQGWDVHQLIPHPDTPPRNAVSVAIQLTYMSSGDLFLGYAVEPAGSVVIPDNPYGRRDNLWRHTCFEFFVKRAGQGQYREFNFAPFGAWAGYAFSDWRRGMEQLPDAMGPHLVDCRVDDRRGEYPGRYGLDAIVPALALGAGARQGSLTAVVEETDGTKSYWALAHPPGAPNFHHPACFVLTLPAAG